MTIQYFEILEKEKQQDLLFEFGSFLDEIKRGPFRVMLFQMESFYVEVYFLFPYTKIAWVRSFESTDELEPYLQNVDVSEVLQEVF